MVRLPREGPERPARRVVGPQSALTDFLASRNISSRQIEENFQARRDEAARLAAEDAQREAEQNDHLGGFGTPVTSAERVAQLARMTETPAGDAVDGGETGEPQLTAKQKKVLEKIKQNRLKKKKKKKRKAGETDDETDEEELLLSAIKNMATPLPGQMDNCAKCGKRFTVTPYSRADDDGQLLCTPCGKERDKDGPPGAQAKKKPRTAGGGPVGQRRKAQSGLLDGASPVGPKSLATLCLEHLARNIDLADDLGDLPEEVVERIARRLAKRRLVNPRTVRLFVRPGATDMCVYDGAELVENDYLAILQAMPRLRRLVVHNAIQFKDGVLQYLQQRNVELETLCLYGANLLSATAWKAYLVDKGAALRTLHICHTDKHITEDVVQFVRECAPALARLKLVGNQAMAAGLVEQIAGMDHLRHLGLSLDGLGAPAPVHADVLLRLIVRRGPRLETLSLRRAAGVDNTVLAALHAHAHRLRKLRITDTSLCTDAGFVRLFTDWANPPLRFADLERCRYDDPDNPRTNDFQIGLCSAGFQALMAHSGADLEYLNICACRHIGRDAFEAVFAADHTYPQLRRVEASFCEEITDDIVRSMFRSCPNLKELSVFGCMRVTGVGVPAGRIVVGVPNALGMQTVGKDEEVEG